MSGAVHIQVLIRAAEILGGNAQLRAYLRVSIRQLEAWITGRERVPSHVFLRAVDLISEPAEITAEPEEVGRARALRVKSGLIAAAAGAARENALRAQNRASALRSKAARVLDDALHAAVGGTEAKRGNVQLLSGGALHIVAQRGFERPFIEYFTSVTHDSAAACGEALKVAKRVIVTDVVSDPIFAGTPACEVMRDAGALAVQSTPLLAPSGKVLGMLSTHYERPHEPSVAELETIDGIARRTVEHLLAAP